MIRFLTNFLNPYSNCEAATIHLCRLLNVPVTKTTLKKQLEEHPDYPMFLSISDVLNNYGVDNAIASFDIDKLQNLPVPFIALIKGSKEGPFFTIIKKIEGDNITLFDFNKGIWTTVNKEHFKEIFLGEALYIEISENAGEKEYDKKLKEEKRGNIIRQFIILCIPCLTIIAGITGIFRLGINALLPVIFSLLTLAGAFIGVFLLSYQYDRHNPALQQICSSGKKVNCGNILDSDASKIFGISWGLLGFSYFMGQLLLMLFLGITHPKVLFAISWLSILALPYTFFSVYYQWRIAKQWCVLCLSVQAILLLQFIVPFIGGWHSLYSIHAINPELIFIIITAFALPFIVVSLLMPALEKAKEVKQSKRDLHFLKRNPEIFEALLSKQKAITEPIESLGITLGNNDARFKLIKVSNPYCEPCAKAHIAIDELLENNADDILVQEIYFTSNNEGDKTALPVKHLLSIAGKENEKQTKCALDDWYLTGKKDYEAFAAKYPMNGELKMQDQKIDKMHNWCMQMNITSTPTFFVNGYQLPKIYTIHDLKYFLTKD